MRILNNKRRSPRNRKKLHIGEFQELGFHFEADIAESFTQDEIEQATDAFIADLVEPHSLELGGWLSGAFIQRYVRGSATDEDREAVRAWLEARPEVLAVRVGPLLDAWYPPTEDTL